MSDNDVKFITPIPPSFTDNDKSCLPWSLHVLPSQIDVMNWFRMIFSIACEKCLNFCLYPDVRSFCRRESSFTHSLTYFL